MRVKIEIESLILWGQLQSGSKTEKTIAIFRFHLQIFTETLPHTRHVSIIKHNEEILSHRITGTRETDIANFSDKTRTTPINIVFFHYTLSYIYICAPLPWLGPKRPENSTRFPETRVTDSCEPLCRCWG